MNKSFFTSELKECLNRNSKPGFAFGDMMEKLFSDQKSDEKLLPVVGTQGMGKSTLINAIIGEDILPNNADETTCVPVEVAYGEEEYAEVYFRDSNENVRINTRKELNSYVDNNENPGNNKGVEHIRLYRNSPILKSGLIIVDLPGVGSVTTANEDTTRRYIENVRCAIFVIPTVPTIRRTESLFIRAAWSQFNNAIFVENDFGETEIEKRDSVEHNTKILSQIAEQFSLNFEKPILVINAYEALTGKLHGQESKVSASGIKKLLDKIASLSTEWNANLASALHTRVKDIIVSALAEAKRKLNEAQTSEEKSQEERKAAYERQKSEIETILQTIDDIEEWMQQERLGIRNEISNEISKSCGSIRAEITNIINNGVVDGDNLSHAFKEIQTREIEDFSSRAIDILTNFSLSAQEKLIDLAEEIEVQEGLKYDSVDFKSKEKLKWEKGANYLFKAGGAAGAALGAKAMAVAILGSNPAGWAVLAVGAVIYGIASLFGFGIKKSVMERRKKEAKSHIYPKIDEIESNLKDAMFSKINETIDTLESKLEEIRRNKKTEIRELRKELRNPIKSDEIPALEADITLLSEALKVCINV